MKIQIISAVILLLGGFFIIFLVRRRKLELKYGLPWLAVILLTLLVDCFPVILSLIADGMGIELPVNALFLLGLIFAVALIFVLTVIVSRQSERIKRIVQASALNEEEIRRLSAEIQKLREECLDNGTTEAAGTESGASE